MISSYSAFSLLKFRRIRSVFERAKLPYSDISYLNDKLYQIWLTSFC